MIMSSCYTSNYRLRQEVIGTEERIAMDQASHFSGAISEQEVER